MGKYTPHVGSFGFDEFLMDEAMDVFERKLDAVIENSDKPRENRNSEEIIKDILTEYRPRRKSRYDY